MPELLQIWTQEIWPFVGTQMHLVTYKVTNSQPLPPPKRIFDKKFLVNFGLVKPKII